MSSPVTEDPTPNDGVELPAPIGIAVEVPAELRAVALVLSAWRALGTATGSPRYELSRRCPELHRALVRLDEAYRD